MSVETKPTPVSRLAELDATWRAILASPEQCPPVLGLAAFSEEQEAEVTKLVHDAIAVSQGSPLDGLLRLLQRRPAVMLVWLARKAATAYRDGGFYDEFEATIGAQIPITRRQELVSEFSQQARALMVNFTAPPELGTFWLVETFLFHAGLPLCHCASFAKACRWVEQNSGLPSPAEEGAGEELRDAALACSYIRSIPILQKSLRGPAGPLACAEALNLIFEQDAPPTNPRLTAALREAFANVGAGGPRRSARQPFLRLAPDLCSLEVVGPRQESSLLAGHGSVWLVNGKPHRRGFDEDFVFSVRDEARVEIELRGLTDGLSCRRVFELDWAKRPVPFILFDTELRREKRLEAADEVTLRSGEYWLVHSASMAMSDSGSRFDWPDGRNAISQLTLRPGRETQLEGDGRRCRFRAAQVPFLEPAGQPVRTDDGQRVYFGWTDLPEIWCPAEDDQPTNWQLVVTLNRAAEPRLIPLRNGVMAGAFLRFVASDSDWLRALPPGLHHLRCVVTRGGRRSECVQEFWYWAGLNAWTEGEGFECSIAPANLRWADCHGLEHVDGLLFHRADGRRQHRLAFEIAGDIHLFCWSRNGIFLECFERRAGVATQAEAHSLESGFSADSQCSRWLRVWRIPAQEAELRANGQLVQVFAPGRTSTDVSLAHLATLFPKGGTLTLNVRGLEIRIASFHRPLTPAFIELDSLNGYESLTLKFSDEVRCVRPRLREIISGREIEFEGRKFGSSGHCLFQVDGLPQIECAILCDNLGHESQFCRISLDVPKTGWPPGIWFAELDIRREESQGWQPVRDELGGHAPLIWREPPTESPNDPRSRAIWWAAGKSLASEFVPKIPLDFGSETTALADLLAECEALLTRGHATVVWPRVEWSQTLTGELARQAAKLIGSDDGSLRRRLLVSLAREQEITPRSLIVSVPALLASPAEALAAIEGDDAVRRALKWCSKIGASPTVCESLRDDLVRAFQSPQTSGLLVTLQHFKNFTAIVQGGSSMIGRDFMGFDFARYWQQTIGSLHTQPDAEEWQDLAALGRSHAHNSLAAMLDRRRKDEGGRGLAVAASIFALAEDFRRWLRLELGARANIMTDAAWQRPWLDVEILGDALPGQCARFCSVFALAARAAAAGWLDFNKVTGWLHHRPHGVSDTSKAVTTLACLAPELLGYYLMFWELICRTSRHE